MYLAVWISFHPFQSLAEPPQTVTEAGDRVNQVAFSALFLALGTWTYFHEPQRLLLLVRPIMVVALLWCAASVIFSWEPALAARRLTFTVMVMGMAAMVLLLPKDVRQFSDMMAAVVLIVLALCYLGLVLAPQLTIHQATDFVEPEHAGDWRGIFNHKNMAGVTMVLFIFVGMFVARARSFGLGALIVVLSSIFLGFTGSKTAIGILPLTLILSAIVTRTRRPALAIALVLVLLVGFNLCTVGSIYFEPIRHLVEEFLPDPTFTGRTELWEFAVEHVMQHPLIGYGFYAFWGTEEVVYALERSERRSQHLSQSCRHHRYSRTDIDDRLDRRHADRRLLSPAGGHARYAAAGPVHPRGAVRSLLVVFREFVFPAARFGLVPVYYGSLRPALPFGHQGRGVIAAAAPAGEVGQWPARRLPIASSGTFRRSARRSCGSG
jgi:O-Antigen ligase